MRTYRCFVSRNYIVASTVREAEGPRLGPPGENGDRVRNLFLWILDRRRERNKILLRKKKHQCGLRSSACEYECVRTGRKFSFDSEAVYSALEVS